MRLVIFLAAALLAMNACSSADAGNAADSSPREAAPGDLPSQQQETSLNPYFNDREKDIVKIQTVLEKISNIPDVNSRVVAVTREFTGTPYVGGTLNIPGREQLYVNTSGMDCTTFVETVMALASAAGKEGAGIDDFLRMLKSIRYRGGEISGYPSRLHYISEWSLDNTLRGNFKEITPESPLSQPREKTIDFMTKNRQLYPPMKDDSVYEAIKENEKALKYLHFSIIPTADVDKAVADFLKSGDIVAIVTDRPGLDVSHVGIVEVRQGIPYLIHASSKYNKVINDSTPLKSYLSRQRSPGIRVFRLP